MTLPLNYLGEELYINGFRATTWTMAGCLAERVSVIGRACPVAAAGVAENMAARSSRRRWAERQRPEGHCVIALIENWLWTVLVQFALPSGATH